MPGSKNGKASPTEVSKMRAWLATNGMPAAQAALMSVTSKTRAQISQALIEWMKQRPKKS